jgi:ABC-type antimicrobial peptide transport system permease subunit
MTTARDWTRDLAFGLRLAVSGRKPWGRLAVTAIGIALGVALLLAAASIPNVNDARESRDQARWGGTAGAENASVLVSQTVTYFRDDSFQGLWVQNQRPDAAVAPGLVRNPQPGEVMVSPALQALLASPDGALLQPRFPKVAGVIGEEGLIGPNELFFYAGTNALSPQSNNVLRVADRFGELEPVGSQVFSVSAWFVLALGIAALLVPIVVYVAATSRLAETARQRRLSAMRLVGASGKQVHRMAAGEALAGALLGVALGWGLFFLGRTAASGVTVVDIAVFAADIQPVWWLATLVTLGIPAVAVLVTIGALQHTITEPLEVTRQTVSRPRRLVWRLVPLVVGSLGLLAITVHSGGTDSDTLPLFVFFVVLVLIGIPVLLPWCVERAVGRLRGGSTAWQLAVRRLQLTSGTAARSVGAIAVVVAGVIALQTALAAATAAEAEKVRPGPSTSAPRSWGDATLASALPPDAAEIGRTEQELRALPGVEDIRAAVQVGAERLDPSEHQGSYTKMLIADCVAINKLIAAADCRDGDAFALPSSAPLRPGERLELSAAPYGAEYRPADTPHAWNVPAQLRPMANPAVFDQGSVDMVLTPAAAVGVPDSTRYLGFELKFAPGASPDLVDHVRNVAAAHLIDFHAMGSFYTGSSSDTEQAALAAIRTALLAGAVLTFALIGCSLFVAAAEQIQERRRPLAVLGAVGVPKRTLWWSQLLQNGVPMLVAAVLATVVGMLLGVLVALAAGADQISFDVPGMLGLFAFAIAAVVVVTALTLPALNRSTQPTGLRTE